jgi:hypothetical protein
LQDEVELASGMKVMVTWNVFTELDVANGTHGEITDINKKEDKFDMNQPIVLLHYPPCYILVKLSYQTHLPQRSGRQDSAYHFDQ